MAVEGLRSDIQAGCYSIGGPTNPTHPTKCALSSYHRSYFAVEVRKVLLAGGLFKKARVSSLVRGALRVVDLLLVIVNGVPLIAHSQIEVALILFELRLQVLGAVIAGRVDDERIRRVHHSRGVERRPLTRVGLTCLVRRTRIEAVGGAESRGGRIGDRRTC